VICRTVLSRPQDYETITFWPSVMEVLQQDVSRKSGSV